MQFLDSVGLAYLWGKITSRISSDIKTNVTNKLGLPNGICPLDEVRKVPAAYLPSYVDDIKEFNGNVTGTVQSLGAKEVSYVALCNGHFVGVSNGKYYNTWASVSGMDKDAGRPENWGTLDGTNGYIPLSDKIYIDTSNNKTYRWSGKAMVEISSSLALGETSSTAYAGDKGKALADKLSGIETNYAKKSEAAGRIEMTRDAGSVTFTLYGVNGSKLGSFTLDGASYDDGHAGIFTANDEDNLSTCINKVVTFSAEYDDVEVIIDLEVSDVNGNLNDHGFIINSASRSTAGVMTAADKTKLDAISSGATADSAIPTSVIDALS